MRPLASAMPRTAAAIPQRAERVRKSRREIESRAAEHSAVKAILADQEPNVKTGTHRSSPSISTYGQRNAATSETHGTRAQTIRTQSANTAAEAATCRPSGLQREASDTTIGVSTAIALVPNDPELSGGLPRHTSWSGD